MRASKLFIAMTSVAMLANVPLTFAADPGTGGDTPPQSSTYMDDAGITTKVKTKYLTDKMVSALNVKVETKQGVVYLSGEAKSDTEKQRATELAMSIEGVKDVRNEIQVK